MKLIKKAGIILTLYGLLNVWQVAYLSLSAQNPILPGTAFIPDGEPHVFEYQGEKRVFVYGSRDERVSAFCGFGHDVWSAPIDDLTKWTNHGEIFNVKQVADIGYGKVDQQHFGAPDCVYNPYTNKYYLYTFLGTPYKMDGKQGPLKGSIGSISGFGDYGPKCVMAISDTPVGPFLNPVMCDWAPVNDRGTFDPTVLVMTQDDGPVRVFAFWGMLNGDCWAEISPTDMHTVINGKTGKPDRNACYKTLNNPGLNGYFTLFEASSIKQVAKDKFVFICSPQERISALTYFYSNSPEGPWTYGGPIVDNGINWRGGNNHGSIVEIKGKWYVVFHRKTVNDFSRQAMMEPIELRVEGDKVIIPQIEITTQGVLTQGLDAFRRYPAYNICYLTKDVYIDCTERSPDGLNSVVVKKGNSTIGWKYFNFGAAKVTDADKLKLKLNIKRLANSTITVQVALPTEANNVSKRVDIETFNLQDLAPDDGAYHEIVVCFKKLNDNAALNAMGGLKGKLAFFLTFKNEDKEVCRLKEYELVKGSTRTANPLRTVRVSPSVRNCKITAIPTRGRAGESVKLSVVPDEGYQLKDIEVKDAQGRVVEAVRNATVPYAPINFNFKMPESAVIVSVQLAGAK